jgi:carbamoyl-phosphate synthase large subunit
VQKEPVLVTATGSIVGEGIIKCLKLANASGDKYQIITADMRADAAGLYRGDNAEIIPSPSDSSKYYDAILSACIKYSVRAIFPGSDEELIPLATLAPAIEKETGAKVIANPLSAIDVAVDKWKTYKLLKNASLDCAESCLPADRSDFIEKIGYPVIVKPRTGHGSINIFVAMNADETDLAVKKIEESAGHPFIQEYLPSEQAEFTTGVVVSGKGSILSSISMRRVLKHGQTYKAIVEDAEPVRRSSEKVATVIGGIGPVNVQSRLVEGRSKVFEINPRFSASCPIRAVSGVNEPDITFRDQILGERISPPQYTKLVGLRYWNEVYVPSQIIERATVTGVVNGKESFIPDYF